MTVREGLAFLVGMAVGCAALFGVLIWSEEVYERERKRQ